MSFLFVPLASRAQDAKCKKPDLSIDVTHSQEGRRGAIRVSTHERDIKLTLHLLGIGDGGKNDRVKVTTGLIENIPPGTYDLVVQVDGKGYCSETRKVTVN